MFGSDIPEAWVNYADRSYITSRLLWFTSLTLDAPVSAHRTMELYQKAYLLSKGTIIKPGEGAWGHDLSDLGTLCAEHNPAFSDTALVRRIRYFQRYLELVRYPTSIEGKLTDGTGIWFSFDSVIIPLDEVVAFIRPRIVLTDDTWRKSWLTFVYQSPDPRWSHQREALTDQNSQIDKVVCMSTNDSKVEFNSAFHFDLPGC